MQAVRDVMTKDVVTCQARDSLAQAARKMRDEDIGAVIVMQDGKLCGIVTDRDIAIRGVADGKDPNQIKLHDVCSQEVVTITPDRPVNEAVQMMRDKALRRLPVIDGGKPVGVLSLGDLAVDRDGKSVLASIGAAEANR